MIGGNESDKNEGRYSLLEGIEGVWGEFRTSDHIFVNVRHIVGTKEVEAGVGVGNGGKSNHYYYVVRLCCGLYSCTLYPVLSPSPFPDLVLGHIPSSFRLANMDAS